MGTHLRVLSEGYQTNTNMTGFGWFSVDKGSLSIGQGKNNNNVYYLRK